MKQPKALILFTDGTNRDADAAEALAAAGAAPEIVHINQLRHGECRWSDYALLVVPGGFSYGDALGAGKLLALDLSHYFADEVGEFIASGKPVVGICNGFQALVKAGLLPGEVPATLTANARGGFTCRWVTLAARSQRCLWTRGLSEPIYCPVAHGEGRFVLESPSEFGADQIAFEYATADGMPAGEAFPENPNGSMRGIAGICNSTGNVLGLMPHPENHIHPWQHPRHTRGEAGGLGLQLFRNAVQYAQQS